MPPHETSMGQSAVTFAAGYWYVAWGGRPENVTQIQRLTADGRLDLRAARIEGTTPLSLLATVDGAAGVTLLGWLPPAYSPAGYMRTVHRLGLDLESRGAPLLLRSPGMTIWGGSDELEPGGTLVVTSVHDRPGGLVREIRVSPDVMPQMAATIRDWRPGAVSLVAGFDRIGSGRVFLDVADGALRARPLLVDGTVGPVTRVLEIPASEGGQIVLGKRIGTTFWAGAYAAMNEPIVRLRALDPETRSPVGDPIAIAWPRGTPHGLIDALGTPVLVGSLAGPGAPTRSSFVPIDVAVGAACPGSTVVVSTLADRYQMVRAIHFHGDVAGVTVDTWGPTQPRRVFFTRLRCSR